MITGFLHTHILTVVLFIIIYLIKNILLLSDKTDLLQKFTSKTKVAEMIISFLFLITGIGLIFFTQITPLLICKIAFVIVSIPLAVIGFKKHNKILATFSFFLLVVSFMLARKNQENKAGISIASSNGKEIYESKCAQCHGSDGKLNINGAKDLTITKLSYQDLVNQITKGKNTMPAFNTVLTEAQINEVAEYIETQLKTK